MVPGLSVKGVDSLLCWEALPWEKKMSYLRNKLAVGSDRLCWRSSSKIKVGRLCHPVRQQEMSERYCEALEATDSSWRVNVNLWIRMCGLSIDRSE